MNLFLQLRPTPLVLAHRGASLHAPENTLTAFMLAADQGADGIELDAKLTRDGSVVVMHDATVDRTTNGHGRVSDFTLREIKTLDAGSKFGSQFAQERVPLLEEVFAAVANRLIINIELTNYASRRDGLERKVVDLIQLHALLNRVMVSSFNPFALRTAKLIEPQLTCGLLYEPIMPIYLSRAWLAPLIPHLEAHHPHFSQAQGRFVSKLHSRGMQVNVWTVNDAEAIRSMVAAAVDGIMGDDPILIRSNLSNNG
ncbi:MAG TPA: glycerophosphodiester phosphodiesterase family protein [Anaerolineae bacterium]|nr:glycerophosphodiester phosphodiesterase family protein [Anaerolineae bacterium]